MHLETIFTQRQLQKLLSVLTDTFRMNTTMMALLGLALLGAAVWLVCLAVRHPLKKSTVTKFSAFWFTLFTVQMLLLNRSGQRTAIQLIPFRWIENGTLHETMVLSAALNLALFTVLSALVIRCFAKERRRRWVFPVCLGVMLLAVGIEALQYMYSRGTCSTEDVILAFAGALLGCLLSVKRCFGVPNWIVWLLLLLSPAIAVGAMYRMGGSEQLAFITERMGETASVFGTSFESYTEEKREVRTVDGITEDAVVAPDRYNTGVNNIHAEQAELTVLDLKNNKKVVFSGGGSLLASTSGFIMNLVSDPSSYDRVYANYDFAETQQAAGTPSRFMVKYDEGDRTPHTITFVNCRFPYMTFSNKLRTNVRWKFYHCTFTDGVAVSNAEFYDCQFGSNTAAADVQCDYDTLFDHCFFWYGNDYVGGNSLHADGVQVSGIKDDLAGNITIRNCAFEIIYLKKGGESGHPKQDTVNACIMIQPDYGPVDSVLVENCYVNGGGYTMYCFPKKANITNAAFRNVTYGCSMRWNGVLYPTTPEVYGWENVREASALRVGSVWNDNGTIQVSVTNDTNQSRTLRIVTNLGTTEVNIPACPKYDQLTDSTVYADLPFNLLTQLDGAGVQWVQCYDGAELIRTAVI